jgi:hypothetical protein
MFQTKVVEGIKTHFLFVNISFKNRAICEIMWKNTVEPDRPQITIWRMRIACWIIKATDTHSEYVILNPFPPHQWLHERASLLRFTCTACVLLAVHLGIILVNNQLDAQFFFLICLLQFSQHRAHHQEN